jgi:prepilin-type N-terminal cleavage/methylation domain-containing protein/prepilin-type processing-associated H-X9-DG protein
MGKATRRNAFTLIELLVVISIIAILTTLIFTALMSSRQRANQSTSSNNLKQWGAALQRALMESHNELPSTGQKGDTIDLEDTTAWFNRLPPYLNEKPLMHADYKVKPPRPGDHSIWINPAVPKEDGTTYIKPPAKFLFCYAMNYFLDNAAEPNQSVSRIENPIATVFMSENGDDHSAADPTLIKAYFGPGDPLKEVKNGAQFLFFDGHVEVRLRSQFDPAFMKYSIDDPSPIDTKNLNRHFTFVPYVDATAE